MSDNSAQVQKLKDEGNAFYSSKDYPAAITKYSEAIELDDSNALIYANRAACRLAIKHYLDALADATKAADLDPTYSKAWARCAAAYEALGQYRGSQHMWKKALEVLPPEDKLTPAEKRLKQQYEAGLKTSNVAVGREAKLSKDVHQVRKDQGDLPWEVASKILDELQRTGDINSSAWTIYAANKDFTQAVEAIKAFKKERRGEGEMIFAKLGTVADLTNAILRDARIFRIPESDFLIKLVEQLKFERFQTKSWHGEPYGPEVVKREAVERLRTQSQDEVRRALTTTVREWIMFGFLSTKVNPNYTSAVEYLQRALDIINWGREEWKDVPPKDRGVIFNLTFRRGVWNLLLQATLEAFTECESEEQQREHLENLKRHAEGLIRDVEDNPPNMEELGGQIDPGFKWSFFDNIRGNAFACIGFYYVQLSEMNDPDADPDHVSKHMLAASKCYYKAASGYPEDDYNYPWYLNCAFQYMAPIGAPTNLVMEILERIRLALPKVNNLWFRQEGMAQPERVKTYEKLAKIEERAKELISEGKMGGDDGSEPFDWVGVTDGLGE